MSLETEQELKRIADGVERLVELAEPARLKVPDENRQYKRGDLVEYVGDDGWREKGARGWVQFASDDHEQGVQAVRVEFDGESVGCWPQPRHLVHVGQMSEAHFRSRVERGDTEAPPVTVVIDGMTVGLKVERDGGGQPYARIYGVDCDLEGEAPGMYYPVATRIVPAPARP